MTLPNKITVLRILLIPIMTIVVFIPVLNQNSIDLGYTNMPFSQFIFLIIFIIASLTDFLDGYLARKNNQITTFGKFLDPIADKILVIAGFLYLMQLGRIEFWVILIIIFREFSVSGIRLIASKTGEVIAASVLGKIKTTVTMLTIIYLLFNNFGLGVEIDSLGYVVGYVLIIIVCIVTLLSGIEYFVKNRRAVLKTM